GGGRTCRPRGSRFCARSRAGRTLDDGHAPECAGPGDRLHVDRERADPRRSRCARYAACRRDQHRLFGADRADRDRRLSLPDSRAVRHSRCARSRSRRRRAHMSLLSVDATTALLALPLLAAVALTLIPGYRGETRFNVAASFLALLASLSLLAYRPETGPLL